jgi:SAM-dependent methyltransferase
VAETPKPRHLAAEYSAQFRDEEVAAAYVHRPPYPPEVFVILESLLGPRPRTVLELGAGMGDLTVGLALLVDTLIAVEPSKPMLERGRRRVGAGSGHVEWLNVAAEDHDFAGPHAAVIAAESFHWLDWYRVMPRIATSLVPSGHLVLVERVLAEPPPWGEELRSLIRTYTTNRDYVPYDLVTELVTRGLLVVAGTVFTETVEHRQTVESYVESFHSRNGFSRARLPAEHARQFDDGLKGLVRRFCRDDTVRLRLSARVCWGRPDTPSSRGGHP